MHLLKTLEKGLDKLGEILPDHLAIKVARLTEGEHTIDNLLGQAQSFFNPKSSMNLPRYHEVRGDINKLLENYQGTFKNYFKRKEQELTIRENWFFGSSEYI